MWQSLRESGERWVYKIVEACLQSPVCCVRESEIRLVFTGSWWKTSSREWHDCICISDTSLWATVSLLCSIHALPSNPALWIWGSSDGSNFEPPWSLLLSDLSFYFSNMQSTYPEVYHQPEVYHSLKEAILNHVWACALWEGCIIFTWSAFSKYRWLCDTFIPCPEILIGLTFTRMGRGGWGEQHFGKAYSFKEWGSGHGNINQDYVPLRGWVGRE